MARKPCHLDDSRLPCRDCRCLCLSLERLLMGLEMEPCAGSVCCCPPTDLASMAPILADGFVVAFAALVPVALAG